jgi:hypothetical protein
MIAPSLLAAVVDAAAAAAVPLTGHFWKRQCAGSMPSSSSLVLSVVFIYQHVYCEGTSIQHTELYTAIQRYCTAQQQTKDIHVYAHEPRSGR